MITKYKENDIDRLLSYYDELDSDIYPQPPDSKHTEWAVEVVQKWIPRLGIKSVLDVGCGEGFLQPYFYAMGIHYLGVCLGIDFVRAKEKQINVDEIDFNFLPYDDNTYELIFSRHSLEHSPFPLLTLMEWHRVSSKYLILILPRPSAWGWGGRNHYSVLSQNQTIFLLQRAGWVIIEQENTIEEYRFLCEKVYRLKKESDAIYHED